MSDGIFASRAFVDGVAPEAAITRTDVDILVGDVLVVENRPWPELEVAEFGYTLATGQG